MDKLTNVNQKKPNKQPKTARSKQPLKVVYITNPIKFKTSASEFRSLVQELTGKDSDVSESSKFTTADGGSSQGGGQKKGAESSGKVALEDNVHALVPKIGQSGNVNVDLPQGSESDPPSFGSFGHQMYTPLMIEDFQGIMGSNLWEEGSNFDDDVFKSM